MARLKVFRTPIGFHDAYVAAPSQKAALEAWGTDANLFARGVAEVVTDPRLMSAALDKPGEIVRVLRKAGQENEDVVPRRRSKPPARALAAKSEKSAAPPPPPKSEKKPKPKPRPSRAALDKAEAAIARADEAFAGADHELQEKEKAVKEERRSLRDAHDNKIKSLIEKRDRAKADYRRRIEEWAGAD